MQPRSFNGGPDMTTRKNHKSILDAAMGSCLLAAVQSCAGRLLVCAWEGDACTKRSVFIDF